MQTINQYNYTKFINSLTVEERCDYERLCLQMTYAMSKKDGDEVLSTYAALENLIEKKEGELGMTLMVRTDEYLENLIELCNRVSEHLIDKKSSEARKRTLAFFDFDSCNKWLSEHDHVRVEGLKIDEKKRGTFPIKVSIREYPQSLGVTYGFVKLAKRRTTFEKLKTFWLTQHKGEIIDGCTKMKHHVVILCHKAKHLK